MSETKGVRCYRKPSIDVRAELVGPERQEWDALNAEADALYARRREVSKGLDKLRTKAWNRAEHKRRKLRAAAPRGSQA